MHPKKPSVTRFARTLAELVPVLVDRSESASMTSVAADLGIDKTRLSRLLSGGVTAGSKTVAQICSRIGRSEAARLLEAYLLDEADTVIRLAKQRGRPKWGSEALVVVASVRT